MLIESREIQRAHSALNRRRRCCTVAVESERDGKLIAQSRRRRSPGHPPFSGPSHWSNRAGTRRLKSARIISYMRACYRMYVRQKKKSPVCLSLLCVYHIGVSSWSRTGSMSSEGSGGGGGTLRGSRGISSLLRRHTSFKSPQDSPAQIQLVIQHPEHP